MIMRLFSVLDSNYVHVCVSLMTCVMFWFCFADAPPRLLSSVWLKGHWMACNASCGTGYQHRPVFCYQQGLRAPGSHCEVYESKPKEVKECSGLDPCTSQWVTGPWSEVGSSSVWNCCKPTFLCLLLTSCAPRASHEFE